MSEPKYDALLQSNEEHCKLDCGCVMARPFDDASVSITFCPMHKDAPVVRNLFKQWLEKVEKLGNVSVTLKSRLTRAAKRVHLKPEHERTTDK